MKTGFINISDIHVDGTKYANGDSQDVSRQSSGKMPLEQEAKVIRRSIVDALYKMGGGHYGGSLSIVDALLVLYRRYLRIDPEQPDDPTRDRLILSKGHAVIAQYCILARIGVLGGMEGNFDVASLAIPSHPDMTVIPGIDFSTGSLGQGLSVGLGMALARPESAIWVILGDGECQEGQIWEAAMLAARLCVENLKVVIDCNDYQEFGQRYCENVSDHRPVQQLREKWSAFGWSVFECNGNDLVDIERTMLSAVKVETSPTVILARTKKGFGSQLLEEDPYRFHCAKLTEVEYQQVIEDLK
ncbi:MAG: transketolase [Calditrichales bacterium]|nr:transketolase [Calditrichales bacterium]